MTTAPQAPLFDPGPELPAWQRGYPLDHLKAIARTFRDAEALRCAGPYARVNEAWVAKRKADGFMWGSDGSYVAAQWVRRPRQWMAFGGVHVATLHADRFVIDRMVGDPDVICRMLPGQLPSDWHTGISAYLPDPTSAEVAERLGLEYVGSRVTSAGDIIGMWARHPTGARTPARLCKGIARLPIQIDPEPLRTQLLEATPDFAQHYSTYNRRSSWTAASLRGYGPADDIVKPAEMSRKWKLQHPGWEKATCADTPLRAQLPAVEAYLHALGDPQVDRIRLMALAPGGGELTRHADSTDPDAGMADGRLCRIHCPIRTNPGVTFTSWALDGHTDCRHMGEGEVWVLDHTKPHAAVNLGPTIREHLVIDAWVNDHLGRLLDAAR